MACILGGRSLFMNKSFPGKAKVFKAEFLAAEEERQYNAVGPNQLVTGFFVFGAGLAHGLTGEFGA